MGGDVASYFSPLLLCVATGLPAAFLIASITFAFAFFFCFSSVALGVTPESKDMFAMGVARGARWLSGRVSDSGARGRGFENYRRRVVSLSKTLYSPKVLVNYPGSDGSVPT